MNKLTTVLAITALLLAGCMKVDNSPPNPLEPVIFPTFTAFFFQVAIDGDTLTFKELDGLGMETEVIRNSIRLQLLDCAALSLQTGNESATEDYCQIMIEYQDGQGVKWTSNPIELDLIPGRDGENGSEKRTIESGKAFNCILHDGSGNEMELTAGLFRAYIGTLNNSKPGAIQFIQE